MLSYKDLKFPKPPNNRPYVIVNMVTALDGKVRSGKFWPLGSQTDRRLFNELRIATDALLIGAGTARKWLPKINTIPVFVVTRTGKVPKADNITVVHEKNVNFKSFFNKLRKEGIKVLLVEGGPNVCWQLFDQNLVDELFLTIAPKILGGRDFKTIVDGKQFAIPRRGRLVSVEKHDSELYLRYNFTNVKSKR